MGKTIILIIQLLFCLTAFGQAYNLKERCHDITEISNIQNVGISDQTEFKTGDLLISDGIRNFIKCPNYYTEETGNIMFPLFSMRNDTIFGNHNILKGEGGLKDIKLINCNNITVNNKNKEYNKLGLEIEGIDDLDIVFYENKIIIRKREQ